MNPKEDPVNETAPPYSLDFRSERDRKSGRREAFDRREDYSTFEKDFAWSKLWPDTITEVTAVAMAKFSTEDVSGTRKDKIGRIDRETRSIKIADRVLRWPERYRDTQPKYEGLIPGGGSRRFTVTCWRNGSWNRGGDDRYFTEYESIIERPADDLLFHAYGDWNYETKTGVLGPWALINLALKDERGFAVTREWIVTHRTRLTAPSTVHDKRLTCGCDGHNRKKTSDPNYCGYWGFDWLALACAVPGSVLAASHSCWSSTPPHDRPKPQTGLFEASTVSTRRSSQWIRWSSLWDKGGRDPLFLEDPDKYAAERNWG